MDEDIRARVKERTAARAKALRQVAQNADHKRKEFTTGFREFLRNYGILTLAIAFIIGGAVNRLVQALVNDIIMPIVSFFLPRGDWRNWTITLGTINLKLGDFIGVLLEFLIIALIVYMVAKWILKEEKVTKK